LSKYSDIPTHIISGFLGAGKTSAIKKLLQLKPEEERWAVIVNEFGQVGIDGALLKNDAVQIKEIAGGCLCCVGSQALSVGLNQLIRRVKPHRIIIEPTGLGHPQKLIDSLTGEFYQSVLDLKAVINLLDARQLKDPRYLNHPTFIDQVRLADILLANKADTYSEEDRQRFYEYGASLVPAKDKLFMVENAQLQLAWLDYPRVTQRVSKFPAAHQHRSLNEPVNDARRGETRHEALSGWSVVEGGADGFVSVGWAIGTQCVFEQEKLLSWLNSSCQRYKIERLKGVIQTETGWISINLTRDMMGDEAALKKALVSCDAHQMSILELLAYEAVSARQLDTQLKTAEYRAEK